MKLTEVADAKGKVAVKRTGTWELRRRQAGGEWEVLGTAKSLEPFFLLWTLVVDELRFVVAIQSVLGEPVVVRILPAANEIHVAQGHETIYWFDARPVDDGDIEHGPAEKVELT